MHMYQAVSNGTSWDGVTYPLTSHDLSPIKEKGGENRNVPKRPGKCLLRYRLLKGLAL